MSISIENISPLGRRITVSVDKSNLDKLIETKLVDFGKNAALKGFRQGKVPMKVVKQKFGDSVKNQALQDFVIDHFGTVIKDENFKIAGQPSIEKIVHLPENILEYIASFEIYPTIKLADLSCVELEKISVDITDQDIVDMIQKLKARFGSWETVEKKTELTDRVTIDLTCKILEKSETTNNIQIILGDKNILPGLSEALLGKQVKETVQTVLTFPQMWHDKDYAGQPVTIEALIHKIEAKKSVSQEALMEKLAIENQDEVKLKNMISEKMQTEALDALRAELQEKVLEVLLEKNIVELPQVLIQNELQAIKNEMANKGNQGLEPETNLEEIATKRVALGLLVTEYVAQKHLQTTPELINEKIQKMIALYPDMSPESVMQAYYTNKNLFNNIERMVLLDQVVDCMVSEMKTNEIKRSFQDVLGQNI